MKKYLFILLFLLSGLLIAQQNGDQNRFLLGKNYEQIGEFEKALVIFRELHDTYPENRDYIAALNGMYLKLKRYDDALELIENQLKKQPRSISYHGELGKIYYLMGEEQKAYNAWESIFEKMDYHEDAYRIISNYALEMRSFTKAVEYLEKGKEVSAAPINYSYQLGDLYALMMAYKKATEEYLAVLEERPQQYRSMENRILRYCDKPNALEQTLSVFLSKEHLSENAQRILASLYIEAEEYENAFQVYRNLDIGIESQGLEILNFAQQMFTKKKYGVASDAYKYMVENYPNSPYISNIKLGYAKTLHAQVEEKWQEKNPLWKPYYKPEVPDSGKYAEVIAAYFEIAELYEKSEVAAEAILNIGQLYLEMGKLNAAQDEFFKIKKDMRNSRSAPKAYIELARIFLLKNDLSNASSYLQKAIDSRLASEETKNIAKYQLIRIAFFQHNFNIAKEKASEFLTTLNDDRSNDVLTMSLVINPTMNDSASIVQFADAELKMEQYKFDNAIEDYSNIVGSSKSLLLSQLSHYRISEAYVAINRYNEAITVIDSILAEKSPLYSDKALYLKGKIFQYGMNDYENALEIYEKLLAIFPDSLYLNKVREEILVLRNKMS